MYSNYVGFEGQHCVKFLVWEGLTVNPFSPTTGISLVMSQALGSSTHDIPSCLVMHSKYAGSGGKLYVQFSVSKGLSCSDPYMPSGAFLERGSKG